jgi:ProQ/FINO family
MSVPGGNETMKMEFEGDKLTMWREQTMPRRFGRGEIEAGIRILVEKYPSCFFSDPPLRRPLKKTIVADLVKSGVPMASELITPTIEWYQSHFGYQHSLHAGAKRLDLNGKEVATVTEQEAKNAQKYIQERREELLLKSPAKPPVTPSIVPSIVRDMTVKAAKPVDPISHLRELFDAVHCTMRDQPEVLRRPLAIAGLRVVAAEIEKCIEVLNSNSQ